MNAPSLDLLLQRNSAPKLAAPGPTAVELEQILQAALRAPDHARLRPWRFVVIEGERREAFGQVLAEALAARDPGADAQALERARVSPLRAPLLIAVAVELQTHPKVPKLEQQLSGGCAAHGILLAAEALGYAGIWRTGAACFDRRVMNELALTPEQELVGFIYLGTRDCNPKPVPVLDSAEFTRRW